MQGRVWTLNAHGYGFIRTEAGDFFFHQSHVLGVVNVGDFVSFWLSDGPKGLQAVEVKRARTHDG